MFGIAVVMTPPLEAPSASTAVAPEEAPYDGVAFVAGGWGCNGFVARTGGSDVLGVATGVGVALVGAWNSDRRMTRRALPMRRRVQQDRGSSEGMERKEEWEIEGKSPVTKLTTSRRACLKYLRV